ncbi:MAG: NmrA/HSCARG family protein [Devosiaceae bacterium]|nr:NmrA/HSCARG family protein [Devosiaceae bacterium MH13]
MISEQGPTIAVFGATGKQGGAVIDALEASHKVWHVKAMTRDPQSPSARALALRGVVPVAGDMNDKVALVPALKGAFGVYSVQGNFESDKEEREVHFGRNVVDAARESGVLHFIYGSVGGAERGSGVPHFEAKRRIELHLMQSGIPFTILRPVSFMDNFGSFPIRTVLLSMFRTLMAPTTKLQLIAAKDIGRFAARAFENPESSQGRQIELAGDELTVSEILITLRKAKVGPTVALKLPGFIVRKLPEDFPIMVQWFEDHGFEADLDALRHEDGQLMTLSDWARAR